MRTEIKTTEKKKHAFTLVELIIVITILAILATIAFISFQGYMKGARDSNRITTITQINKGIETFITNTGNVPMIDNQIGTGTISGNAVTYVGYIGDNVSKVIKLNKPPIDPSTHTNYIYGIDATKIKYQVASILEDLQSNTNKIISTTYADGGIKAKVLGNYQGLLKYNGNIYNIPSLIITFSGSTNQDLLTGSTNYVIDKAENLPYLTSNTKQLNTLSPTQILQKQTNTGATLIVTGSILPTDVESWNTHSGTLQIIFGYNSDFLGQIIFGDKYFSEIKGGSPITTGGPFNCGTSTVSAGGYTYNTLFIAGKCRTVGNMKHGTLLSNGNSLPTDINIVEKWCPMPNGTTGTVSSIEGNCNTYSGALYSWYEAMGLTTSQTTITIEDTSKSVCGQLGAGWHLPSNTDWTALTNSGATGWTGNKLSGLTSGLPGVHYTDGSFSSVNINGYWWGSRSSISDAYTPYLNSSNSTVYGSVFNKFNGYSVLCIKN